MEPIFTTVQARQTPQCHRQSLLTYRRQIRRRHPQVYLISRILATIRPLCKQQFHHSSRMTSSTRCRRLAKPSMTVGERVRLRFSPPSNTILAALERLIRVKKSGGPAGVIEFFFDPARIRWTTRNLVSLTRLRRKVSF